MRQLSLFDAHAKIDLSELFEAYFDCRRNKRSTLNAIAFESNYEANLLKLWDEINDGSYQLGKSIAFIVNKPVKREIFAADFRDRIVHHLIINKLNPLFEKSFIHDSYSCRKGKGTHFGICRVERFIRQCSQNYSKDCYVLKLDIQGFFMHIDKSILFTKLLDFMQQRYHQTDKELLTTLCQKVIFNDPTQNCTIKSKRIQWKGLPVDKSLFHTGSHCGLPIGNLTSQIFANFYLTELDHFIKHDCGIRYYGRYVDDFVLVHHDKDYLKSLIPAIKAMLQTRLRLTLHPKKIYLQHYTKGVHFLGAVIKPHRIYIAKRTQGNFYTAIQQQNAIIAAGKPSKEQQATFLSSMNSYLGLLKHFKSYRLRKEMLIENLSPHWWNRVYLSGDIAKFVLKTKPAKSKNGYF